MDVNDLKLECVRLANSILTRIDELEASDFSISPPLEFLQDQKKLLNALLDKKILPVNDEILLKLLNNFLRTFSTLLTLVENATSSDIPLGLPKALQNLISQLVPGARILFCPMHDSYNYSIFDIWEGLRNSLEGLLGDEEKTLIFGDKNKKYLIVSFPLIEKDNVLLHSVFAHEIGHQIAWQFLEAEETSDLPSKILALIEREIPNYKELSEIFGEEKDPLFKAQMRQGVINRIFELREGFIQELISDISAVHLFGPAGLMSLVEFSASYDLDNIPSFGDAHPPWRYRFRQAYGELEYLGYAEIIEGLSGQSPIPTIKSSVSRFFQYTKELTVKMDDRLMIEKAYVVKISIDLLEEVLDSAKDFVRYKLKIVSYKPEVLKRDCQDLLMRLAMGVPPNETIHGKVYIPVDFRSALNAGWFYKLSRLTIPYGNIGEYALEDLLKLNRLIQKGIELATIQSEFNSGERRQT